MPGVPIPHNGVIVSALRKGAREVSRSFRESGAVAVRTGFVGNVIPPVVAVEIGVDPPAATLTGGTDRYIVITEFCRWDTHTTTT